MQVTQPAGRNCLRHRPGGGGSDGAKDRCLSHRAADFHTVTKKTPASSSQTKGPISFGPHLTRDYKDLKNQHPHDAHCGRKASRRLNRQIAETSVEHNREPFNAASDATVRPS